MGFIKAATEALSSTFADQWQEYYRPMTSGISTTAAVIPAEKVSGGQNTKGNANVITNGSKIQVPTGYALVTIDNGAISGCIDEPGNYIFSTTDPNAQSIFAGDNVFSATLKSTWEKIKFGGIPASEQLAFYVKKEIKGNRFGTSEPIHWFDSFLRTDAEAYMRGTFTLSIEVPTLFINSLPIEYKSSQAIPFDFNDINDYTDDFSNQFKDALNSAVGMASNKAFEEAQQNNSFNSTVSYLQTHAKEFGAIVSEVLDNSSSSWLNDYGIHVNSVSFEGINYTEKMQAILDKTRDADATLSRDVLRGQAFSNNMAGMMAAASANAMQTAAGNENGAMMGFMGLNMAQQNGATMMGAATNAAQQAQAPAEDPIAKLSQLKTMLDQGLITQADYDEAKKKYL